MKKYSSIILLLVLIGITATISSFAQSTQRPEDLRGVPGTWWFMAKLDNPVDTLLLIPSDALPPVKVKTLAKNEQGVIIIHLGGLVGSNNILIFRFNS